MFLFLKLYVMAYVQNSQMFSDFYQSHYILTDPLITFVIEFQTF